MLYCVAPALFYSPNFLYACCKMCRAEFKEVRVLGEGNFSVVRAAKHRLDGIEYAIKRSTKDIMTATEKKHWVQVCEQLTK